MNLKDLAIILTVLVLWAVASDGDYRDARAAECPVGYESATDTCPQPTLNQPSKEK